MVSALPPPHPRLGTPELSRGKKREKEQVFAVFFDFY